MDYGGSGFLQPASAALGLSAALFLSNLDLWQGAGYQLTDVEIDDIKAMIAQLEEDLTNTGDMYPMDKVQATNSAAIAIPSAVMTDIYLDSNNYDPEDMHPLAGDQSRIYVKNDGLHLVSAHVTWDVFNVGLREIRLYKYFPYAPWYKLLVDVTDYQPGAGGYTKQLAMVQDEAVVTDTYRLLVYQNSGVPLHLRNGSRPIIFSVVRLT